MHAVFDDMCYAVSDDRCYAVFYDRCYAVFDDRCYAVFDDRCYAVFDDMCYAVFGSQCNESTSMKLCHAYVMLVALRVRHASGAMCTSCRFMVQRVRQKCGVPWMQSVEYRSCLV